MTTVNQKRIRKTKTSRLSPLSPSPSKIRLSTTDETELASELTDEIQIQQGDSLTPVISIPSPVSPIPVMETVVVTLPVSLTPLLPGIVAQSLTVLPVSTSDNNR